MENKTPSGRVTIAKIASIAGVSPATVSYVINNRTDIKILDETRKKVLDVCRQLDYVPRSAQERTQRPVPKQKNKKHITISDIAEEAGVSRATVSYVINNRQDLKITDATRKKVLQICNLRQYKPSPIAQSLANCKNNMVGICFNYMSNSPSRNLQNLKLILDLQAYLQKENFGTLLLPSVKEDFVRVQENIDGIICIDLSEKQFYALKESYYIPIVAIDMTVEDSLFFKTYNDIRAVVRYAKDALGAQQIIFVTEKANNRPYMDKMKRALSEDTLYVVNNISDLYVFLEKHRNDFIVFNEENLALLCQPFVDPKRAAVVCSDKSFSLYPQDFTRIYLPTELKAEKAIEMLQKAIRHREAEPHTFRLAPQTI